MKILSSRWMSAVAIALGVAAVLPACRRKQEPVVASVFQSLDLPAPTWTAKNVAGGELHSADLRGKVLVIDFWATWCPPCRAEIPDYIKLQDKYRQRGIAFVGIAADEAGPEVVAKFGKSMGINYPLVMYTEQLIAAFGGVEALPTTFVIDRKGRVRFKKVGTAPVEDWERVLAKVL